LRFLQVGNIKVEKLGKGNGENEVER
jgi:hypothetical protein